MRYSITAHKVVAILSLLILSSVQFFLLYNTYEQKNDHYFLEEKSIINPAYSYAIRNDKVFPGGAKIIDNYLIRNMPVLEELYTHDTAAFDRYKQSLCDSVFTALQEANNMDSVLNDIVRSHHLRKNLEYALVIDRLEVVFHQDKYVSLYDKMQNYPLIDSATQTPAGAYIGGSLQKTGTNNSITSLTISAPSDYSIRITFTLYVDIRNRREVVLRLMMPTFLLSLFSVLSVVLLFFTTFRNWLRQKKLSEMKSDFINSINHEFHTPLSAIMVANKTMQKEQIISSPDTLRPLTEVVQRQADRLKILISQVLNITTLNKITLNKEPYSVHLLLDEILLDYRLRLTGANTKFSLQKDAEKNTVLLDRFWFTTILLNIFDNAIKYNNADRKEITVATFDDKKTLYISIRDNGIGMSEEIRGQVFEKFYRHVRSTKGPVDGLGLGLFYVKQAIDAHNWKIEIAGEEGEGSTFIISIPL